MCNLIENTINKDINFPTVVTVLLKNLKEKKGSKDNEPMSTCLVLMKHFLENKTNL